MEQKTRKKYAFIATIIVVIIIFLLCTSCAEEGDRMKSLMYSYGNEDISQVNPLDPNAEIDEDVYYVMNKEGRILKITYNYKMLKVKNIETLYKK